MDAVKVASLGQISGGALRGRRRVPAQHVASRRWTRASSAWSRASPSCVCDLGLAEQLVGRTGFCIHPWETVRDDPQGRRDEGREARPDPRAGADPRDRQRRREPTEDAEALAEFVPERRRHPPAGAARQSRALPADRGDVRARGGGGAAVRASSSAPTSERLRRGRAWRAAATSST